MLVSLVLITGIANATSSNDEVRDVKVVYKDTTEIDFESLEIEGELVKPQGALLLERKRASFNPLIKLRTDFNQEMTDSVSFIK